MIRGIQKNMIYIRTPDSNRYESAYLVLRRQPRGSYDPRSAQLWQEAERLLESSVGESTRSRPPRRWVWFLLGGIVGSIFSLLCALLVLLLGS
jgi:hypothetical protein